MRHSFLSLFALIFFFLVSTWSYAVTPLYDELGRIMNADEVYKEYNPPPKGAKNDAVPEMDRYDHTGMTPLQNAVRFRQVEQVRSLLKKKANPNIISSHRQTALQMAVRNDHLEIARLLLAYKADPNLKDTLGHANSDEMTKLLKAHGARPDQQKEKKDVRIILNTSEEAAILNETIEQARKNSRPIPTLAQAVILDQSLEHLDGMLEKGTDINEIDPEFGSALDQFFEQRRDKSVALFLLEKGADPNLVSRLTHPLVRAVRHGDPEIVSLMLKKGASIKATGYDERQVLSLAAENGQLEIVRLLLQAGAKVNAPDEDGRTALYYVLWRNPEAVDVARLLLENGASTTVAPKMSALGVVDWREKNLDMMLLLLEYKAQPFVGKGEMTLVIWAVQAGSESLLNAAIQAGVDVNARDRDGDSALRYAVEYKRAAMVKVLLAAGAPVNGSVNRPGMAFVDTYGEVHPGTDDLLAIAVRKGDIDVIRILIKAGINLDTAANSFEKPTPLHLAVEKKQKDIADMLLAAGANPNRRDRYGKTPLHIAVKAADVPLVQRLLAGKADPNAMDEDGETPLDEAARRGNRQISEILLKSGGKRGKQKSREDE